MKTKCLLYMVTSFYGMTYFCGKRNIKCTFQEACLTGGPWCRTRDKIERYTVDLWFIISFVIKPIHKSLLKRSFSKIHAIMMLDLPHCVMRFCYVITYTVKRSTIVEDFLSICAWISVCLFSSFIGYSLPMQWLSYYICSKRVSTPYTSFRPRYHVQVYKYPNVVKHEIFWVWYNYNGCRVMSRTIEIDD